ncbi:MAG: hypothetical protein HeimC2_23830 [Candidatus Heimdallarchaeota archaeon LC_2]|nr:MAG: hypothetical protein HeimC2_23830 [Candidatus Heimdallarchaeota archaeon LC_2]
MQYVEILNRLETEIKMTIKNEIPLVSPYEFTKTKYKQPLLSDIIIENPEEENLSSALNIVYASSSFMSVDRIIKVNDNFKRNRRIIYYLDSRTGQIGSVLLLQLLKAESNGTFSKHELVEKVDKEIFQAEGINISSGEITESLSRMFRKTMADFFFIDGRKLVKKPYMLKVQELKLNQYRIRNYDNYKHQIDNLSNYLMFTLNRMIL